MAQFQPSPHSYGSDVYVAEEHYGVLDPFSFMYERGQAAASYLARAFADDWSAFVTETGLFPLSREQMEDQLAQNPRMVRAPSSLTEAYEQGVFFISLAARRADYDNNTTAEKQLYRTLQNLQGEQHEVSVGSNIACVTTGYLCPKGGRGQVLSRTMIGLESSGLDQDDVIILSRYLKANMRSVAFRQAVPVVLGGIVVLSLGGYFYSRSRR